MPDSVWNRFDTVQAAIEYCQKMEVEEQFLKKEAQGVTLKRACEISMPQMARGCLSEHWLFKELGDLHWSLLAAGLGTPSGELTDDRGDRLYATFVRIQMVHDPLHAFRENETLYLEGAIRRFGGSAYISRVEGTCAGKEVKATQMTTFSARVKGDNTTLLKSEPILRKGLLDGFSVAGIPFRLWGAVLFETGYDIHPYYEINGVGLLYFAAYPVISDVCEARFFNQELREHPRWEERYATVIRDIFYFANCNSDDKVVYRLNGYEQIDRSRIRLCTITLAPQ